MTPAELASLRAQHAEWLRYERGARHNVRPGVIEHQKQRRHREKRRRLRRGLLVWIG